MKILVAIKQVIDSGARLKILPDGSDIDRQFAPLAMNPFDETALEEAVRLKEKGIASEILAVSIGSLSAEECLRTALALGADRALLIVTPDIAETAFNLQPLAVAKLLRAVCQSESPDLVLCGKQAIDDDANQTGQMLAGLMNWPQASCASQLDILSENVAKARKARVVCEIDGGTQTIEFPLPGVITADLRLNEPRYASLPNIIKAKRKIIDRQTVAELGVDTRPRLATVKLSDPPARKAGAFVSNVDALLACLKNDAKVQL